MPAIPEISIEIFFRTLQYFGRETFKSAIALFPVFCDRYLIAMLARRQILPLCTLTLLLGGLLGCGNMPLGGVRTTPIGNVKNSWQKYSTVYLKGQVGKQAPFIGRGAYELEDPTGTIWVVTQETLPSSGDTVLLKGQVKYQSIPIAGKELGEVYVEAQKQLERVSSQQP